MKGSNGTMLDNEETMALFTKEPKDEQPPVGVFGRLFAPQPEEGWFAKLMMPAPVPTLFGAFGALGINPYFMAAGLNAKFLGELHCEVTTNVFSPVPEITMRPVVLPRIVLDSFIAGWRDSGNTILSVEPAANGVRVKLQHKTGARVDFVLAPKAK